MNPVFGGKYFPEESTFYVAKKHVTTPEMTRYVIEMVTRDGLSNLVY